MLIFKLTLKYLKKNKLSTIISITVFFIVLLSITGLNWIYKNIEKNIISQKIGTEQNKITITQKENKNILSKLFQEDLGKIYKQLKQDKNLKNTFAIYTVNLPVSAEIKFFGFDFNTDTLVFASDNLSGDKLKIGLNPIILNLYNSQVADGTFFPKISTNILKSIYIKLILGKNSFINFGKTEVLTGNIEKLSTDYPMLGLTINYNLAQKAIEKIGKGKLKIYKLITFSKNPAYIIKLKNKYPNLQITTYNDELKKVEEKLQSIKLIFQVIQIIILFLLLAFILALSNQLVLENKNTIKVFYYHGAGLFKQFSIIFYTLTIYFLTASSFLLGIIFFINKNIQTINYKIAEKGLINIQILQIGYLDSVKIILFLYLSLILTSFGIFLIKKSSI